MKQQERRVRAVRLRGHGLIGACSVAAAMAATLIATPSTAAPAQSTAGAITASVVPQSTLSVMRAAALDRTTFGDLAASPTRMSASAASAAASAPTEGSFVSYAGRVYRIVGGAPFYVSSWTPFGGKKKVTAISTAQWTSLRAYAKDGTFVRAMPGGAVYRIVAAAPFYVSTWTAFGGKQTTTDIDAADITYAGHSAPWWGVYNFTLDWDGVVNGVKGRSSVFVKGGQTGRIYKMVGGAPIYVQSWTPYGSGHTTITVDQNAIDRAGQTGNYRFVLKHPLDGWVIKDEMRNDYATAGGASVYVATPSLVTGITPSLVAWNDINRTSNAAPFNNLLYRPLSPTYVHTIQNNKIYQVLNGVPHKLTSWSYVGGVKPYAEVDQVAVDKAGTGGVYNHLLPVGAPVAAP